MKYVPCDSATHRDSRTYCGYNADCFRIFKTNARLKESFDTRDGTTCSVTAIECPC